MPQFILNPFYRLVPAHRILVSDDFSWLFSQFNAVDQDWTLGFVGEGEVSPESLEILVAIEALSEGYVSNEARFELPVA